MRINAKYFGAGVLVLAFSLGFGGVAKAGGYDEPAFGAGYGYGPAYGLQPSYGYGQGYGTPVFGGGASYGGLPQGYPYGPAPVTYTYVVPTTDY